MILRPLAFLLLLLVPWVLWLARKSYADLTRTRSRVLLGVRVACVVLVTVALAHIILTSEQSDLPVSALFCIDISDSISDQTKSQAEGFISEALKAKTSRDLAGIVTFGTRARVAVPTGVDVVGVGTDRSAGKSDTDLAAAIRLALTSLPEETEKRIILLSDGHQTQGDAMHAAEEAARLGVRIDTLALTSGAGPDVALAKLDVPAFVRQSQPFDVTVNLVSSAKTRTTVKLFVDDLTKPARQQEIPVTDGTASVILPVEINTEGTHLLKVVTETAGDVLARNDTASALVKVGPKPRVLLVAQQKEDVLHLTEALKSQEFRLGYSFAREFPKYEPGASREKIAQAVRELLQYDVIILSNVPAQDLTREQMLLINSYVYDFGGGLVMVGGRESFASGGYYKTPIEAALPVYTDPMKEAPVFAVVLIMDKSWSMGDPQKGDISKIDMVKESVIAAIERLTRKDHLAVISFDTEVHTIMEMQRVEGIPEKVKTVSTMASFGLTNFYPALIQAQRILKNTAADYKHAILLSDGRPSGPGKDYEGQLEKMRNDQIVVSAVAVGVDADKKLMNNIAAWGKGQFYFTEDVKAVPEIILKETGRLTELLLVEGEFKPRPGPHPHSVMLKGVEIEAMPAVLGFNRSRPKETAQVELVVSSKDEPLLASWRYGAGSTVAFTSDAKNVWCPRWILGWEKGFATFWRQLVLGTLSNRRGETDYSMTLVRKSDRMEIVLDAADRLGRFVPGQQFAVRLSTASPDDPTTPEPGEKVPLTPAGPGRYTTEVKVDRDGCVLVEVTDAADTEITTGTDAALAPDEYLSVGTNQALLEAIREVTGGKVAQSGEVFTRSALTLARLREFDVVLLAAATVLFAIDILVRRLPALLQLFRRGAQGT